MMSSVIQIEEDVSGMEVNQSPSTPFTHPALYNDIVVENIISFLGNNPHDLMKYRLVAHKWNDAVVRKINKSGHSYEILLRYGPQVPKSLVKSDAKRWAEEVLENVMITLTGSAARIFFDTVVVDRDFYLAEINSKWTRFLEIQGESIRHLKLKIRPGKSPKTFENHVTDSESVVSMENLQTLFSSTPNLESLEFVVRFNHFGSRTIRPVGQRRIFLDGEVHQLQKLTKITIHEPYRFPYSIGLLKDIISMAPHLTSFYIKPTMTVRTMCLAMKSLENKSLSCFGVSGGLFLGSGIGFPSLGLTKLEINNVNGSGRFDLVNQLLRINHSTLVTVILGNRVRNPIPNAAVSRSVNLGLSIQDLLMSLTELSFPPVMKNLKVLQVNLNQFKLIRVRSYIIQFPVLESLTLSVRGSHPECQYDVETLVPIMFALKTGDGPCLTLKELTVICHQGIAGKELISRYARETFPTAEHRIGVSS